MRISGGLAATCRFGKREAGRGVGVDRHTKLLRDSGILTVIPIESAFVVVGFDIGKEAIKARWYELLCNIVGLVRSIDIWR